MLFFQDMVSPGTKAVAKVGGSLNHSSLVQAQWISPSLNKGCLVKLTICLMSWNNDATHFTTVTRFAYFEMCY